jgi:hypothetical protein
MKKVTIYEFDNVFDIYDESGTFIIGGFKTEGEAVIWCKKSNLEIVDLFFVY